jgi:hypothetical protein
MAAVAVKTVEAIEMAAVMVMTAAVMVMVTTVAVTVTMAAVTVTTVAMTVKVAAMMVKAAAMLKMATTAESAEMAAVDVTDGKMAADGISERALVHK